MSFIKVLNEFLRDLGMWYRESYRSLDLQCYSGVAAPLLQITGNLWGEKPQPSRQISSPSVSSTEAFPQVWGLLTLNAGLLWHSAAPRWDQDAAPESSLCSITSHISLQWRGTDRNDSWYSSKQRKKHKWDHFNIAVVLPRQQLDSLGESPVFQISLLRIRFQ